MSHLSAATQKTVREGLQAQGAIVTDTATRGTRVLYSGRFAFLNLAGDSGVTKKARLNVLRIGLEWPLDPKFDPDFDPTAVKARGTGTAIEAELERASEAAKARALAAEERLKTGPVTVVTGTRPSAAGAVVVSDTQADEPLEGWIDLTPEYAERLLGKNTDNRSIRPAHVAELARDMAAGNWRVTGDSIKFDINDKLIDGQHRLLAVIKSGVTIKVIMVIGLQPNAREVIDTNARRSTADALKFEGHTKNATIVASAARIAMHRETGGWVTSMDMTTPSATNSEVVAWVAAHPAIHQAATFGALSRPVGFPPSPFAYFAYEILAVNADAARQFMDSLFEYTTAGPGDPRHTLIKWIAAAKLSRRSPRSAEVLFVLHRAWNAWRAEETLTKVYAAGKTGDGSVIPKLAK